jgi:hypothetical protein
MVGLVLTMDEAAGQLSCLAEFQTPTILFCKSPEIMEIIDYIYYIYKTVSKILV